MDRGDPARVRLELQARVGPVMESEQDGDPDPERRSGEQDAEPSDESIHRLGHERDDERARRGQQHRQGHCRLLPTAHPVSLVDRHEDDGHHADADEQEGRVPLHPAGLHVPEQSTMFWFVQYTAEEMPYWMGRTMPFRYRSSR